MSSNRHRRQGGTTPTTEPQNSHGVAQFSVSEVAQFSVSLDSIPAVCVVPPDAPAVFRHVGVQFVACPATRPGSGVQCSSCGGRWGLPLCAQAARSFVVTFPAHGARGAAAARHCS